ncbi:tyrosine-protein phosphatase [Flavobacterium cheonhonense]|uniref:tyrosine-protein phosphatase n=1 Tax=Flavobacterium cheonhonense TaxID=706185 RepID=UPI002D77BD60|nr:CpsB/CapC family capsule biosynthesis tyrosine phosphatase [Flavobacterium cheonhonense]
MLSIFKTKPLLKDLIPKNFVDIHSHLLPGIDDGSKSVEETASLMTQMNGLGINHFITTPHIFTNVWDNTEAVITKKLGDTKLELKHKNCYDTFEAGAEYMLDSFFLKRLETEKLLTLKNNYLLVEMSYLNPPIQLFEILFEIQLAGYKPILAHPERYLFYHKNHKEFHKLKNSGCFFQLNLLATVGYYGKNIETVAEKLLHDNFYDFVGSDIHHQKHLDALHNMVKIKSLPELEKAFNNNLFFL